MPTLKIDGQEITVEPGTTILKAAQQLGVEVPTFCYHPGLTIAANCRMCLVKTNKSPKPLPACHATCMDGMEVDTSSEEVSTLQKAVLEFILLNHPVDCPICDQAGECVLQDNYRDHSLEASRLFSKKVHKAKVKSLGPTVVLDAERCILCTRCVRFCDEVTETGELRVSDRGEHSEITTFPGKDLNNPYSLNVVDICPVGALTSKDFRFQRRVWQLQGTRSVCTGCSRGCNIRIDAFEGEVERFVPMLNPLVNRWWLCDEGRLSHRDWNEGLLQEAREGNESKLPREVADALVAKLTAEDAKPAVVLSPALTNEDNWAAMAMASILGASLYVGGKAPEGEDDDFLRRADKNPNGAGLKALTAGKTVQSLDALVNDIGSGAIHSVVFCGGDHALPEGWGGVRGKLQTLGVLSALNNELAQSADYALPAATPMMMNGTMVNCEQRVQRLRRGVSLQPNGVVFPHWRILKRMASAAGSPLEWKSESEVFDDIVSSVEGFGGLTYDNLGDLGLPLGSQGEIDYDADTVNMLVDSCAPEGRDSNVGSRMPWQH